MMRTKRSAPALVWAVAIAVSLTTLPVAAADFDSNWHQWRGPHADGHARGATPPLTWSTTENVKWKVAVPGEGQATPIIWENKIFVAAAVHKADETDKADAGEGTDGRQFSPQPPRGEQQGRGGDRRGGRRGGRRNAPPTETYQYSLLCLDRATGKTLWERVAIEAVPHEGKHSTSSFASISPTTDGERVYCSFGSRGVFCYSTDGELLWKKDLGDMRIRNSFGEGSSPVVHGDALVHLWDHEGDSFIVCLDAKTGKERWRVERDEPTTWNTPLITEHDGVTHVIANGSNRTRSYDLKTGKVIWECGGQVSNPIPSPLRMGDHVICMSGYRGNAITVIPLSARGDITDEDKLLWSRGDAAPYVASPVLYEDKLYFTKSRNALISCADAKTGKLHYGEERLPEISGLYASLLGADGRVYVIGRSGKTIVLEHGPEFKVLAVNDLGETVDASPVAIGNELYIRTEGHLYCLAEGAGKKQG